MARRTRRTRLKAGDDTGPESAKWISLTNVRKAAVTLKVSPFASDAEKMDYWLKNRAAMMAECAPGSRPSFFYESELKVTDFRRFTRGCDAELGALLDHSQITELEAIQIETLKPRLNPKVAAAALAIPSVFDSDAQAIRQEQVQRDRSEMPADKGDRSWLLEECRRCIFASRWHEWRGGRQDLVDRYERRAKNIRQYLES